MGCRDLKELFNRVQRSAVEVSGNINFFFHYPFHDFRHYKQMDQYFDKLRNTVNVGSAEYWLLKVAVYLHDIGMFLNPRNWHKLGIPKSALSPPGEDLMGGLEEDAIVKTFLEGIGMSFDDAFFDENDYLRLPPPLKEKTWDEFNLVEKLAVRTVMRKLHPLIGEWAVKRRFIGEHPPECRKISEMIGGLVRLHEDECDERIRDLGAWEVAGTVVDQRKLMALLMLLDGLDCAGQSRASPEVLDEIIDEVRMLEEKSIEIEAAKGGGAGNGCGHLPHWVFKRYIKEVRIGSGRITVVAETSSPSHLAGILFFEVAGNVWPKYAIASRILDEYGCHYDLTIEVPGPIHGELLAEEELMKLGEEFSKIDVEASELPREVGQKHKTELKLPRALALLISYGGSCSDYAEQLAKKHACRLLANLKSVQKSRLEEIFKCT
jgi:hypothetical protein